MATTFSYWEKRRKDFGQHSEHLADDLKPFWYQSAPQGVTVVRYADGTFATVEVVTEDLEALEGARVYYGGKANAITVEEADELAAAGYGDFILSAGYGSGLYGMGAYGISQEGW